MIKYGGKSDGHGMRDALFSCDALFRVVAINATHGGYIHHLNVRTLGTFGVDMHLYLQSVVTDKAQGRKHGR